MAHVNKCASCQIGNETEKSEDHNTVQKYDEISYRWGKGSKRRGVVNPPLDTCFQRAMIYSLSHKKELGRLHFCRWSLLGPYFIKNWVPISKSLEVPISFGNSCIPSCFSFLKYFQTAICMHIAHALHTKMYSLLTNDGRVFRITKCGLICSLWIHVLFRFLSGSEKQNWYRV